GMDTAQLRDHAERLRTASGEVEDLTSRLGTAVRGAGWTGPDAEEFRARWTALATGSLASVCAELTALGGDGLGEADHQDIASEADGQRTGPGGDGSSLPPADDSRTSRGSLHQDSPWIPYWLEGPAEAALSGLAERVSDGIGWGADAGIDLLGDGLGPGERVPTFAASIAAGLLTAGAAGVGFYEAVTGRDAALVDDRPGGIVESGSTDSTPSQSPQTPQDLILQNDALRMDNPTGGLLESGQIGIQEVHRSSGGEPVYIVQVPPT